MWWLTVKSIYFNINLQILCFGYLHTIEYIKFAISQETGINKNQIDLIHDGHVLNNYNKLKDYGIDNNSIIMFVNKLTTGF